MDPLLELPVFFLRFFIDFIVDWLYPWHLCGFGVILDGASDLMLRDYLEPEKFLFLLFFSFESV
jgi:hypothetical protein